MLSGTLSCWLYFFSCFRFVYLVVDLLLTVFMLSRWCFITFELVTAVIFPVVHVIKFLTCSVNKMWNDALKSEDSGWYIHKMEKPLTPKTCRVCVGSSIAVNVLKYAIR